ncbi:DUF2577 domain-containing protein (plasmid) [Crassaminicella thermophila]|uniref:DUF2577 domain-containing protein n=1 Tax=Crassaminicella thermophila TaxID=2599308 RepID=A0A5C0SHD4_CRATE|nr:DUF2577 domain-containing protein [Crassaminicella thermophila]QEK13731.1 DUF2577 domain-containing protein [Crassaminicella thermophila]
MDGISELAKMLKERDNQPYLGPQIGEVITPPPNIQIALGDKIILTKEHLVIAAHVLTDYQREINITGDIQTTEEGGSVTLQVNPAPTTYTVVDGSVNGNVVITGTIKYTDTLKKGDKVILIPSTDEQTYFLIDKAVML